MNIFVALLYSLEWRLYLNRNNIVIQFDISVFMHKVNVPSLVARYAALVPRLQQIFKYTDYSDKENIKRQNRRPHQTPHHSPCLDQYLALPHFPKGHSSLFPKGHKLHIIFSTLVGIYLIPE